MKPVRSGGGTVANGNATNQERHAPVLVTGYGVNDSRRRWALIGDQRSPLAAPAAPRVVLYDSIREPRRVPVTPRIRHRTSVKKLSPSPTVFSRFDSRINESPAISVGAALPSGPETTR